VKKKIEKKPVKEEKYSPVKILDTDRRLYLLKYDSASIFVDVPAMEFSQLDLLQITQHLAGRNERLRSKIMRLIDVIDKATGQKTDFSRKLPRRDSFRGTTNGDFHARPR